MVKRNDDQNDEEINIKMNMITFMPCQSEI